MKCQMCKYKHDLANSKETGAAVCTRRTTYFPVNYRDNCHFIPLERELVCSDCARFGEDFACVTAKADDKVYNKGRLCSGYIDAKELIFKEVLMFWKVHKLFDRVRIEKMIDEFESFYDDIEFQGNDDQETV